MFDFQKWREWLKAAAGDLRGAGFATEWKPNDEHLRSTALSATGMDQIGCFRCFENGFVDYEVLDTETGLFVADEAMIAVNDENFADVFQKFSRTLRLPK